MTKTNPYQVIIDLKLEGDYVRQDSVVDLMKEFAKREIEALKQQSLPIDSVSDKEKNISIDSIAELLIDGKEPEKDDGINYYSYEWSEIYELAKELKSRI